MLVTFPLWLIATTCQSYPVNPGDTDLADVAEPHAARASEVRKMHTAASARNRTRCPMGIVCLSRAALPRVADRVACPGGRARRSVDPRDEAGLIIRGNIRQGGACAAIMITGGVRATARPPALPRPPRPGAGSPRAVVPGQAGATGGRRWRCAARARARPRR